MTSKSFSHICITCTGVCIWLWLQSIKTDTNDLTRIFLDFIRTAVSLPSGKCDVLKKLSLLMLLIILSVFRNLVCLCIPYHLDWLKTVLQKRSQGKEAWPPAIKVLSYILEESSTFWRQILVQKNTVALPSQNGFSWPQFSMCELTQNVHAVVLF